MDAKVKEQLERLGITDPEHVLGLHLPVEPDGPGRGVPGAVVVEGSGGEVSVTLKRISELFVGASLPPSFARGPTPEYESFFKLIEQSVLGFCSEMGRHEYDAELERLYLHLRRRPDGTDSNPLFATMQAAARLYMSLCDVSRAEFEAVAQRLSRSAGHFKEGGASTNYCQIVGGFV